MALADFVNTFGTDLLRRYGHRVHKLAIHAGFTCPNRDGSKGTGGCSFCNNRSFSPHAGGVPSIAAQIAAGRAVIVKRTGARRYIAYFQAYTNTYAGIEELRARYDAALAEPDVVGLSIGTRPDCVSAPVLDLLTELRDRGYEVWLELGLQSSDDQILARVNRGHRFGDYRRALRGAQQRGLPVCTHLIAGLPGADHAATLRDLERVLDLGVAGLKLHPLHVVRGTPLARQWQSGDYRPLSLSEYLELAADVVERTPPAVVYHRLTGTAAPDLLLAPAWCAKKWLVLNGIERTLRQRGSAQGRAVAGSGLFSLQKVELNFCPGGAPHTHVAPRA